MYNLQVATIHHLICYFNGDISNRRDGVIGNYGRNSFIDGDTVSYEVQRLRRSRIHQIYGNINKHNEDSGNNNESRDGNSPVAAKQKTVSVSDFNDTQLDSEQNNCAQSRQRVKKAYRSG